MSQHIAGPYGADVRDHVISYRAKHDIGERERDESMVEHTMSLLHRGIERTVSRERGALDF